MTDNKVVTRFAPSPTGFLHIGGGRTALFNWLYAKHTGGKCLLRIEDTDKERSTQEATDALLQALDWLGLDFDGETVYQSSRAERHAEVARELVAKGQAYYCQCSKEELEAMREEQTAKGLPLGYDGRCRDKDLTSGVIRIKAPKDNGEMVIQDLIQGEVRVKHSQLDDFILLREDGSPTYMLSVVVDDHDMGITHICRGDDHLNNAFRQSVIYNAMGWEVPKFAHMPLIHGQDGKKLSKRHGATGMEQYEAMGYLPEAFRNYLLRLGWGHGDIEIIDTEDVIKIFELSDIGKSPARMDIDKLNHINAHYMKQRTDGELVKLALPFIEKEIGTEVPDKAKEYLTKGMEGLKERSTTLVQLASSSLFYVKERPIMLDEKAASLMDATAKEYLVALREAFINMEDFNADNIKQTIKDISDAKGVKMGNVAMPLRAALTGTTVSPSIFHVAEILGKEETLARMNDNI